MHNIPPALFVGLAFLAFGILSLVFLNWWEARDLDPLTNRFRRLSGQPGKFAVLCEIRPFLFGFVLASGGLFFLLLSLFFNVVLKPPAISELHQVSAVLTNPIQVINKGKGGTQVFIPLRTANGHCGEGRISNWVLLEPPGVRTELRYLRTGQKLILWVSNADLDCDDGEPVWQLGDEQHIILSLDQVKAAHHRLDIRQIVIALFFFTAGIPWLIWGWIKYRQKMSTPFIRHT